MHAAPAKGDITTKKCNFPLKDFKLAKISQISPKTVKKWQKVAKVAKNKSPLYDFETFDDFRFSSHRGFQKYQVQKWSPILDSL